MPSDWAWLPLVVYLADLAIKIVAIGTIPATGGPPRRWAGCC